MAYTSPLPRHFLKPPPLVSFRLSACQSSGRLPQLSILMTAKDRDSQFKRWLAHVRFDKMPAKMPARHMRHLNNSQKSRSQKENLRKNQDVKKRGKNTRKSPTKMLVWFVVCVKICLKQIVF